MVTKFYRYLKKLAQKYFPAYPIIERYKVYIKYIIAGSTAAVADLGSLYVFTELVGLWYLLSAALAFVIAFFVSFSLQKFWTFRDSSRERIKRQISMYFGVAIMNLGINTSGMFILVDKLHLWYMLAQIIMGGFIAGESFLIYRFFIFSLGPRRKQKENLNFKQRILIAAGIFPPDIGGPATYAWTLSRELFKLGWEVKVVAYSDNKVPSLALKHLEAEPLSSNLQIQIFRIKRKQNILFRYFQYFKKVWRIIKWAQVVYIQGAVSEGLPTWLACKLRRKKYLLKIVGDYAWEQGIQRFEVRDLLDDFQNKSYNWRVEFIRKVQRLVARDAEKIIVPSKYLKTIVQKWGIKEDKVKVVYNAVEKLNLDISKEEARKELNLFGDIIFSAGRLVPWKGMETLINLMPELLRVNPMFKLIIIGDGPEREKLEFRIKDLKLADTVKIIGSLEQRDLGKYMRAADIFVLNSGYEGLPHIIIEAMQMGLSVITTKIGGNLEVVENKKTGLLVEYNNKEQLKEAILNLWKDKDLRKQLIVNAQKDLEKFNKENIVKETIEIF